MCRGPVGIRRDALRHSGCYIAAVGVVLHVATRIDRARRIMHAALPSLNNLSKTRGPDQGGRPITRSSRRPKRVAEVPNWDTRTRPPRGQPPSGPHRRAGGIARESRVACRSLLQPSRRSTPYFDIPTPPDPSRRDHGDGLRKGIVRLEQLVDALPTDAEYLGDLSNADELVNHAVNIP
jgi:hypothetical protein